MTKTKTFDCVRMKDEIHALLRKEYEGLTDDERRSRVRRELETSDDPVARKWREIRDYHAPKS